MLHDRHLARIFAQVNVPPTSPWSTYVWFMIIAIGLIALMACIFLAKYFNLWIQAKMTQANVSIWELVGMSFRKVNPNIIVRSKIMAYQAGLSEKDGVTTRALEAHYLAGGNVPNVVRALIAANRADIPLSYKRAAAIDLAGRNVLEAVQTSVNPKVIQCPDPVPGPAHDRRRRQERHPAQGEGEGDGPDEPRPAGRRRHR